VRLLDPGEALVVPPHPDGPWQPPDAVEATGASGFRADAGSGEPAPEAS
jgi:hypothetical protein